jgi:type IV pilus assembly protein PilF
VNAEKYFINALQIEPLNPVAAYQLANIQFDRGDAQSAQRTLQNVVISSPNPESLWLGVKIERQLGNKDNEASYAIQLRKLFPNARETQLLINSQP